MLILGPKYSIEPAKRLETLTPRRSRKRIPHRRSWLEPAKDRDDPPEHDGIVAEDRFICWVLRQ